MDVPDPVYPGQRVDWPGLLRSGGMFRRDMCHHFQPLYHYGVYGPDRLASLRGIRIVLLRGKLQEISNSQEQTSRKRKACGWFYNLTLLAWKGLSHCQMGPLVL